MGSILTTSTTGWTSTYPVVGIAPSGTAWVAFSLVFYKTNTGEVNYVDTASLTETTVSFATVKGPLHTTGNRIYDANGNQVVFRGIHRDGTEWSSARSANETEIAQAKSWGANLIRVPLNEALWLNTCVAAKPSNDPSYPGKIDSEVNWITSRGMVALLDLHFNVTALCGTGAAQRMADSQFSPTLWSQLAARYKGNPLVAFDLYNEPHDISDAIWLNGGNVQFGTTFFKAAGMQQLYNTVRNQGASNLIVVSGKDWANRPASTLVTGTNIVHGFHFYTCPNTPPPNCSAANPYDSTSGFNNWTTVASKSPVMVTEFGWPDKNNGIYINNVINNAEARGWGWDVFAWDGATGGTFDLLSSLGSTYQPSPAGIPVVTGLMKN